MIPNIGRHMSASSPSARNITWNRPTKPAVFEATERNAATGMGAPS
jgi:hypothetical protein